jgi:hypothetical protein
LCAILQLNGMREEKKKFKKNEEEEEKSHSNLNTSIG